MSVCNGSFVLAGAGLLDGRTATCHHGGYGPMRAGCDRLGVGEPVRVTGMIEAHLQPQVSEHCGARLQVRLQNFHVGEHVDIASHPRPGDPSVESMKRHHLATHQRPLCRFEPLRKGEDQIPQPALLVCHHRHHDLADSFDHARPRVVNAAKQSERCFMAAVRIRASSLVPSNTAVITSRTRSSSSRSARSVRTMCTTTLADSLAPRAPLAARTRSRSTEATPRCATLMSVMCDPSSSLMLPTADSAVMKTPAAATSRSSRDAGTRHRSDVISSLARRTTSGTPLVRRLRRSRDSSLSDSPAPRPSITVLVADFVIHDGNCDENAGRAPHTSRKRRRPPRRAAFNRADDEIRTRDPHLGKAMPAVRELREPVFRALELSVERRIPVCSVQIAERSTTSSLPSTGPFTSQEGRCRRCVHIGSISGGELGPVGVADLGALGSEEQPLLCRWRIER